MAQQHTTVLEQASADLQGKRDIGKLQRRISAYMLGQPGRSLIESGG
jgi:hypothetical protein